MEAVKQKKCTGCKLSRSLVFFINGHDKTLKRCQTCRDKAAVHRKNALCVHKTNKYKCVKCGGKATCVHKKIIYNCIICSQLDKYKCVHKKQKSKCVECDGSGICEHKRVKSLCVECNGNGICEHKRARYTCKHCNPVGHFCNSARSNMSRCVKEDIEFYTSEYIGCNIKEFKVHIASTFKVNMSWDNYGKWQLDHIHPLQHGSPSIEDVKKRLHWTNTQALWAFENSSKGNRFIG